jgi:hypothetical protein
VQREGVYRINYDFLKKLGINPASIDPRKIRIHGNPGGMLPQSNSSPRPADLIENAIMVSGESDGKFDTNDFILFYASGADRASYDQQRQIFRYEYNLYSDENFYFLTVGDSEGKRLSISEDTGADSPVLDTFADYVYHGIDQTNILNSGREWYGEKFSALTGYEHTLRFDIEGIVPGSEIKMVSDIMGQSYATASVKIFVNDVQVGQQPIIPIPVGLYSSRGIDRRDTIKFQAENVNASLSNQQEVRYEFVKATGYSQGNLDFFLLTLERQLKKFDDQTIFTCPESLTNSFSAFHIENVQEGNMIWDVTTPDQAMDQTFRQSGTAAVFSTETSVLKKFIVFGPTSDPPRFVAKIEPQDLHGISTPHLLIVTHELFLSEANRLANHRRNYSGWTVHVATTSEIYNEFSSGRQDVTAIRDFVKFLHDKTPGVLRSVLLFGKSSYDYKQRVNNNSNFVPTYESRNSLHPLQTYSSDDFFAFLESSEGEWLESPAQAHTLDIGVGRLPVRSTEDAIAVVDKIIDYETDLERRGSWRKRISFVADDGNTDDNYTSLHQTQSNTLSNTVDAGQPFIDSRKIFMGMYPKVLKPNAETSPRMSDDIIRAFDEGSVIINYTGHGNEELWANEEILTTRIIPELKNDKYPFVVTATCEFGRHDDPFRTSGAEMLVTKENAGAIGMVTTARPVNATTNFDLNQAFYEALFERNAEGYFPLGEVFKNTKNNSVAGVANRNFSLLADPSMTLALPPDNIHVNSIKTESGSDTLKALSTVIIDGEIQSAEGSKIETFDGEVEVILFDKEFEYTTTGRNVPPFSFKEWSNVLFRGTASVKEGVFSIRFIIPKNIDYTVGEGKLSLYAFSDTNRDAAGSFHDFKIGGTEKNFVADNTSPEVSLFIGDSTFTNGSVAAPDTYIVAYFKDESGINISKYGIGTSISATLDGSETFDLTGYYVADRDNFTRGSLRYPLYNLQPGRHTVTLKVWDVFNNHAESTVEFVVTGDEVVIESFGNYPNPFIEETKLFFTHNRSGDDLEAHLFIYSVAGDLVGNAHIPVLQSQYKVELMDFDNSGTEKEKLPAGLYLARLVVRSLTNGSKNEQVTKLIILN